MPLMTWYKSYSINNEELDKHHKTLFGIFNTLYDICIGNDKHNSFDDTINKLVMYSDYHFRAEEHYMMDTGYKDIDRQISEHEYFKLKVIELTQKSKTTDTMLCHDTIIFLGNWLMNHVIKEDKKIVL